MEKNGLIKIGVVGAESTGKSELCEKMAAHFNTLWVPEYAREYFNHSSIYQYTLLDLERILEQQLTWETEYARKANRLLFCDTTAITLKIWAELEFSTCPPTILQAVQQQNYDFYLICNNDIDWQADPLRQNKFSRDLIFQKNLTEVKKTKTAYEIIKGTNDLRLNMAIQSIEKRFKHK